MESAKDAKETKSQVNEDIPTEKIAESAVKTVNNKDQDATTSASTETALANTTPDENTVTLANTTAEISTEANTTTENVPQSTTEETAETLHTISNILPEISQHQDESIDNDQSAIFMDEQNFLNASKKISSTSSKVPINFLQNEETVKLFTARQTEEEQEEKNSDEVSTQTPQPSREKITDKEIIKQIGDLVRGILSTKPQNTSTSEIEDSEDLKYMSKVDEAWNDKGSALSKKVLITLCALLVAFILWASFASIDEVARGQGQVIPSQRTQIIQHLEGGILEDIFVTEGQTVEQDEILARVNNIGVASSLRDTNEKILHHTASIIRLEAERDGTAPIFPEELKQNTPLMISQLSLYQTRTEQWDNSQKVLDSQIEQKIEELNELVTRLSNYKQAHNLALQRLELIRPLVEKKLHPEVDFLNLRQEALRFQGDIDTVKSTIIKTESAVQEMEQRKILAKSELNAEITAEVNTLNSELNSLLVSQSAGQDRVTRTDLRSPVRGIVNRILLTTKGGVVQPGESIMEIVPLDGTLLIDTKIRPQDIAFIHPGQKAIVKITAYDASIYGGLDATVEQIGADSVTVDNTGEIYYPVKVRTEESAIFHQGEELPIIPGMVASVDILTGKKTILSYLMKPITKARQNALKER